MTAAPEFARRAERACTLAKEGGPAASLLSFAAALLSAQRAFAEAAALEHARRPLAGSPADDLRRLSTARNSFFASLRSSPAPEVADEAQRRSREGEEDSVRRLVAAFDGHASGWDDFLSRALLRPYLETLRAAGLGAMRTGAEAACPFCGGDPGVGFLKSDEPSEGARRHLVCASCGLDRAVERIRCAACGEEDPSKLHVFSSERHPGVRLEACEACRRYLKTLDLTLDARLLPEVDDLLSVAMDLWAAEEGWRRIEPGLAGI